VNKTLLVALVATAALPLAACVSDGYYDGPTGPGPVAYDGYYDDYYGPIYDGYWGNGDVFYYRTSENGHFRHDSGHHFRHDTGTGPAMGGHGHAFHPMHGAFTPPAGHMGGGHHH
jgi:hypothetical protein